MVTIAKKSLFTSISSVKESIMLQKEKRERERERMRERKIER